MNTPQKTKSPTQILGYFDFLCKTGFSTVSENLIKHIIPWLRKNNMVLDIYPINMLPHDKIWNYKDVIRVINPVAWSKDLKDVYYRDGFLRVLAEAPYKLVWIINDLEVITPMVADIDFFQKIKDDGGPDKNFKILHYFPIDSPPSKSTVLAMKKLEPHTDFVTYTRYAKDTISKVCEKAGVKPPKMEIMGHGVDRNLYRPPFTNENRQESFDHYWERGICREILQLPAGPDQIVLGNINQNNYRKDIGCTLLAYAMVNDLVNTPNETPEVVLYLHMAAKTELGLDIPGICDNLGLEIGKHVFLRSPEWENKLIEKEKAMQYVYGAIDIYVNTTTAEGWGLTVHEAIVSGKPCVFPRHTSLEEVFAQDYPAYGKLWIDTATKHYFNTGNGIITKFRPVIMGNDGNKIRLACHPDDVAAKIMDTLYHYLHTLKRSEGELQTIANKLLVKLDDIHMQLAKIKLEENPFYYEQYKKLQNKLLNHDWVAMAIWWQKKISAGIAWSNQRLPKNSQV